MLRWKLVWKSYCDKKVKSTVLWTYVISDRKAKNIVQKELGVEKIYQMLLAVWKVKYMN